MSILEGEIAEIVADALIGADVPYQVYIVRTTNTEPPPDWPTHIIWEGSPVTTEYAVMGWVDTFSANLIAQGVVNVDDAKIVLLQPTMPFRPVLADLIKARGQTYTVLGVHAEDPAKATLELRAKR